MLLKTAIRFPLTYSSLKSELLLLCQPSNHLGGPLLDSFQFVNISLVVGGPKQDTLLQIESYKCGLEENNHFPQNVAYSLTKAT